MGSTRLPGKVLLPAFDGKNILDIVVDKLQSRFADVPVYILTGPEALNGPLGTWGEQKGIPVLWGSETDVLSRFQNLAQTTGADYLVRICSDNPFLDMDYLQELFDACAEEPADYIAHRVNGTPSIRTHIGVYAELVAADALLHCMDNCSPENREHVTSYLYGEGKDLFRLKWIEQQQPAETMEHLRLSVDTEEDIALAAELYTHTHNSKDAIQYVLQERPDMAQRMAQQIEKFKK